VPRVVLVFDADAGGNTGVDRALEVFVRQDMDLRVARLPEGLDPCDLLVQQGPEPFRKALEGAIDVFEHKLERVWQESQSGGVDARHRAIEHMLGVLALTPDLRSLKVGLMVNRIAHRLSLKEETVWKRLREVHASRQAAAGQNAARADTPQAADRSAPAGAPDSSATQARAPKHEVELVELLLAEPDLVALAQAALPSSQIEHPHVRLLVESLYRLLAEGLPPDLDQLRGRLDNESLLHKAFDAQRRGLDIRDRRGRLSSVLARFRERENARRIRELHDKLQTASDHDSARELLRRLRTDSENNGTAPDPQRPSPADGLTQPGE